MTEEELSAAVRDLATVLGWRCYHTYDSRRSQPGFPDWVMVRDRVIFAELKSERGRISIPQQDWLFALGEAGAERYCWHPVDWTNGTIEAVLTKRAIGTKNV